MVKVTQDTLNYVTLTLSEKSTLDSPYYLLELVSNQDSTSKVVRLAGDTTLNVYRYNRFPLTLADEGSEDLANGIIHLLDGTFNYYAWESTTTSMDLADATGIVESGELVVTSTEADPNIFPDTNTEYTFV